MPTYDIPSFQDFADGESATVRSKLNSNFDNAETYLQGVEDRLEESLTALHVDGVIWKRPEDVADLIVSAGAGLSVNVTAGEALIGYRIQDTGHSNDAGNGITDGATNYCFLLQGGTLWFNTTGTPPTTERNTLLATVTALGGVITAVNNYANGVVRGVGQPALRAFTCTATEAVRDAVYVSAANTVAQAQSDDANPARARVVGVILAKESATSCIVATDGAIIGGYAGLSSGSAYYLQTSAGALGTGKPTAPDPIVPVGIAVSTTTILVKIFVDEAQLGGGAGLAAHAASHQVGGSDPLTGALDGNARVGVRRNSAGSIYARRRMNLIEGSGVNISVSDDPTDEEVDISIASTGIGVHAPTHESGGADALALGNLAGNLTNSQHGTLSAGDHSGDLSGNARLGVRKNTGGSTYKRRRVNLIEGTNITMTVADDAGDEEVDVTINAAGAGGVHASSHQTGGADGVYYSQLERSNVDPTLHDGYTSAPHVSVTVRDEINRPDGRNLCLDPSFENADSALLFWTKTTGGSGVTPAQSSTSPIHGSYCCKLSLGALTAGEDYSQVESQFIPVCQNEKFNVTCYLKSTNGTEYLKVFLDWYNSSKVLLSSTTLLSSTILAGWTGTNLAYQQAPPVSATWCKLRFRQTEDGTAGDCYVDDIWFELADPPITLQYVRQEIIVVVAGTLAASTTVPKPGFMIAPAALTIEAVECEVDTASTGASIIVDIHKILAANKASDQTGTTIYTTQANRPTIAAAAKYANAALPDVLTLAQGDVLRIYVDQIGSTVAGSDLTVAIRVKQQSAWS